MDSVVAGRVGDGHSGREWSRYRSGMLGAFGLGLLCLFGCVTTSGNAGSVTPSAPRPASIPMPQGQAPALTTAAVREVPSGSLWSENSSSLYQDIKAKKVGDIVTITVSEESKGTKEAATNTTKDKALQGSLSFSGVTAGNMTSPVGAFSFGPYQGSFKNDFAGKGATSRTDSISAYMTATVVDVMPNGNLVIRGSRWTKVNEEMQQTILEGVVRPSDITRNNTVLSQNIADAKIFLVGKGPVTSHQKPGWLGQVIDAILPF
ncbi:MAG: flagellar basal body L-ring protein FlgH [Syntrophobacteraceae bacterium]